MKKVADKQILMAADFAGYPLKEEIKAYLEKKGWTVTDVGVKADSDPNDTELMFHRIGLRVGAMITEKEFERALIFCGTGMGIHIAASKCPGVHAGVVESVPAGSWESGEFVAPAGSVAGSSSVLAGGSVEGSVSGSVTA